MATDFSQWPTKQEARMQLGGVPERTFDRWLSEHNIKVAYRKVTGRRPVPVVDPGGLTLLQREMMTPAPQAPTLPTVQQSSGMPVSLDIPPQWREIAATFISQVSPTPQPLFLSLEHAVSYSGLT